MKKINNIKKVCLGMASFLFANIAFAADNIGDTAEGLSGQISSVTDLMVIGGTLLGIVFLIVGGLNLKKHGDNPQQVPLSKPLIFLAAGALLFGLGSTSDVIQSSLFGTGRVSGGTGTFSNFNTSS